MVYYCTIHFNCFLFYWNFFIVYFIQTFSIRTWVPPLPSSMACILIFTKPEPAIEDRSHLITPSTVGQIPEESEVKGILADEKKTA